MRSLADIRHDLAGAEQSLARLSESRPAVARARLLGDDGSAVARLTTLDAEIEETRRRVGELRTEAAECEQAERVEKAKAAGNEAAARPALIARLREEALNADADIDRLAQELCAAIDRKYAAEGELGAALDSAHFNRSRQALLTSIPSTIAKYFTINAGRPMNMQGNNLLGMVTSLIGTAIAESLHQRDLQRMDDLVRVFATKAAALEAENRLHSRGDDTVTLDLGEAWLLVGTDCVTETAEAAWSVAEAHQRRGDRAAVFGLHGLFVVADPHLAAATFGEVVPRPPAPPRRPDAA